MPQPPIFKSVTDNLKNAISAIVGRAIRSIRRFTTALHNKCNLVVYVDAAGRTCCQFLKKDAFTGYHFEFKGSSCTVTNKESGDVYVVEFGNSNYCNCPAFRYDRTKSPCKHIKMVGEYRGDLEKAVALTQKECNHDRVHIGLDAHYCPDCKKSIEYGTALYEEILNRGNKQKKKQYSIDPQDVPTGIRLKRTDDWMSEEYDVFAMRLKNLRQPSGEMWMHHPAEEAIGRIVLHPNGIYTYRLRSGIAKTYETTKDALASLVRIVGTTFDEIAQASAEYDAVMKRRIARL